MRRLAVALLLLAATARADTLSDMRAALQTLHGRTPVRATYEVQASTSAENEYKSAAAVDVRLDGEGLAITFPRLLIDKLATQGPRGEKNEPNVVHAADVSASNVTQLLNYGPALLRLIDGAKIVQERQGLYGGNPARIVVLSIPQHSRAPKLVKVSLTMTVTLWLGPDHLPLALERNGKFSAGILFLKAEGTQKESLAFLRRDDRLVVVRRQSESAGSGIGESMSGRESESIALK